MGFLGVQFDKLVESREVSRSLVLDTDVARLTLTLHANVVSCMCELHQPSEEGSDALRRRGAVDDVFMISPKLAPRDFGQWLERLLLDDLGADPETEVHVLEPEPEPEPAVL
ncbi:MAG: hypothetical protein ACHQ7M_19675 [Chloroflexota bacterium]